MNIEQGIQNDEVNLHPVLKLQYLTYQSVSTGSANIFFANGITSFPV
jgi:hypothetical protein